ncbi:MAG: Gfo/Idh/MocA family protein [Methanosarcinales archaeon]
MEVVNLAAKNGVHVLCDKPIATNLQDANKIIEVARKNNIKLMVPFNPRYQLPVIKAKEMIDNKDIGELQYIYAVKYGKIPIIEGVDTSWFFDYGKAGAGGFGDIGIHAIDALRWLSGSEAKKVYANIGINIHKIAVDDIGQVIIEFDNGVIACLSSGWANPQGYPSWLDVKFEILGSKSALTIEKPYHDFYIFDKEKTFIDYWYRRDIQYIVDEFINCIMENREPAITGEDAKAALEIVLAAYESAKTGMVVKLR